MNECRSLLDAHHASPSHAQVSVVAVTDEGSQGVVEMSNAKPFPLTMAAEGAPLRIQTLRGGKGLAMRLTELGLNQGSEVRIVQRQGSGIVVARGETRIALGGGMAMKILVTEA